MDPPNENEIEVDEAGFNSAMDAQREAARAAGKFGVDYTDKLDVEGSTDFTGYDQLESAQSKITGLFVEGEAVDLHQLPIPIILH